jgi:enoyl-CoA hydratase/carnithine racemase
MTEQRIGSGTFLLKGSGEVKEIVMNRPSVLNAADLDWMDDLHFALDAVEGVEGLRIVVVSGLGSSFCTGIDLNSLASGQIKTGWFQSWERAMRRLELLEPVTIAKMQGYAIGGGLQVGLACDLRIASEDAQLGLPAVLEALIPGLGTFRLPRFVGLGRAKRMILTGELLSARQSLDIGLVDWVAEPGQLDALTTQIVDGLLKGSGTAQCFSKWLTLGAFERDAESVLDSYLDYQARTISSKEHRAAMDQYLRLKGR